MPRLYVVDTNVVVSGVLRFHDRSAPAHDRSAPALVLGAMIDGTLPFLLSADLLAEYRRVLLRPRISARHGWEAAQVDMLLAAVTMVSYLRHPADDESELAELPADCPPGDRHILDLLAQEPSSVLTSGDQGLIAAVCGWRPALTPRQAAEELGLSL